MAFAQEQDDLNKQQQAPGQQVQPLTSSAPGAGPATASKSTPQATPSQPFQNLSAYLSANAPQISNQANTIAQGLTSQYGQVQNDINQGKTDFGNQVQAGYAQPNTDLVNQAASNPTAFVQNPSDVKAFQSLYNDQYTGPSNFESTTGYGNLTGEVNKAMEQANLTGTTGGLQTYFQNQNPSATRGGNLLDSVLLQGSPEAYTTIQNAAKPFSNLTDYLNQATTDADAGVTNAQNTAQQTARGLQNQYTGARGVIPTFQADLNNRLSTFQQNQQNAADTAIKDFLAGKPSTEDAQVLGSSPSLLQALLGSEQTLTNDYGIPGDYLRNYITQQNPSVMYPNTSYAATPDDVSRAQALAQLTGTSPLVSQTNTPGSLLNFDTAGAQQQTSERLRSMDMDTIQKSIAMAGGVPQAAGKDFGAIATTLQNNPSLISDIQKNLRGKDLQVFNNALQRLNLIQAPPPPPTGGTTTPPIFYPSDPTQGTVGPGSTPGVF